MHIIEGYTRVGGQYPETAALTNVLQALGLRAPHTGQPLSEAMILGISGGLGAGYILWEFQEHQAKVLVLGFHNRWQYSVDYYRITCERLGITAAIQDLGGKKAAVQTLDQSLDRGIPAIAWVDRASMPYLQLPNIMKGHLGHIVTICGQVRTEVSTRSMISPRSPITSIPKV